jgi:tetratricopeptide (TPR) repeat protein
MAFKKAKALQEAHKYAIQGKNTLAIKQYLSILEHDPSDLILLNTIGDLYVRDKNLSEGLKQFYKLAGAYVKEGFIVRAIAIYKKIAKIDRDTAEPALKLAELYQTQGLAREAREQLLSAFEFYNRNAQKDTALEVLRKLSLLDGNLNARLELAQYAESAGLQREAVDAYLEAAQAAGQQGNLAAAESALNKATQLAPDDPEVQLFRAHQAFNKRLPEQVERILASTPGLLRNPRALRLLFEAHLAGRNLDAAGKLLPDVFRANPSDFSPISDLAAQCLASQDYDRAFKAVNSVARDLIERRETEPLLEVLRKIWAGAPKKIDNLELIHAISEKANDEVATLEVLSALGRAYLQAGEFGKAEQVYAKLVAREPSNATYKDLLKQVSEVESQADSEAAPEQSSPLAWETRRDAARAPEDSSGAAGGTPFGNDKVSAAARLETVKEEIPPFNYQENQEEIAFYLAQGFHKEARKAVRDLEEKYPQEPAVATLRRMVSESQQAGERGSQGAPQIELQASLEPSEAAEHPDVTVDLAGDLASILGDRQSPGSHLTASDLAAELRPSAQPLGGASAELSSLLDEFREGAAAEEASDDPLTHYNLGVAFREMGLFDEAIGEFQKVVKGASRDQLPPNFLQACTLLAACFRGKGMPAIAAKWYSRALEIPDLDEDAELALRYDLGVAYEQAGDCGRALEKYTEVYTQNIDYRDVADKIRTLQQRAS